MRYTESKEQSAELLRRVLSLLGQHDAPFHPVSYAVWYEFAAGTNARLTQAIEHAMQTQPRLTDATVLRLYQDFVVEVDQQAMQRITGELQRLMVGMAESATRTGDHAGSFGAQLSNLSHVLQAQDSTAIASQVAATLVSTAQMQSSAQELHAQVQAHQLEIQRLQSDLVRARDEATLDPLTQVLNRKGFDRMLSSLLQQRPSPDSAHCLVMLDIDHFKKVNDTHGHVMGDRVIQALGQVLRASVADKDYSVARYGGEEFAILVPDSSVQESFKIADTVRQRIKAMKIRDRRTQEVVLTVSISGGVAAMQEGDDAQDFIARADAALYKSKQAGRDQVTCAA